MNQYLDFVQGIPIESACSVEMKGILRLRKSIRGAHRFAELRMAVLVLLVAPSLMGQSNIKLPCDYAGNLLRNDQGEVIRFGSEEMKRRAQHKTDISDFMRRTDFKDTHLVEIVVGPSGDVICAKTISGLPVASVEVEKAVRGWRFRSATKKGQAVSYVGILEFSLCNISCGEQGVSMTILK